MATQLGNITKSLGREFGIIMSNMAGNELFSNSSLRENSIIISSPIDPQSLEDRGTYSIFATDGDSNPIRLTYTIEPGKGLYTREDNPDVLHMVIDDSSIMADDGDELYVNKRNIIDSYTLSVVNNHPQSDWTSERGVITVVTANLDPATDLSYGISKGDEHTINVKEGVFTVNTQNLDTVDDSLNRDGIVKHNSERYRTIKAENGKLSVLTYNLEKANKTDFGVVKTDEETIHSDLGTLSVITDGLDHSTINSYGISKGDEHTINVNDGVFKVNTQNLDKATYDSLGVVIPDSYSLEVDVNGKIYVRDFQSIESLLNTNPKEHDLFAKDIDDLKNRVFELENKASEKIEIFDPVGETRTILPKPTLNENGKIENDPITKTVPFTIKTNCKYYIKVGYELNENPQVKVVSIQVGDDGPKYSNYEQQEFEATDNKTSTINITFSVANYTNKEDNCDHENTKVFITVCSINDSNIRRIGTHIFTRWNTEAFTPDPEPEVIPDDPNIPVTSTLIIHKNSGKLNEYPGTLKETSRETSYGFTNSYNFYFNYKVDATYTYNDSTGKLYSEDLTGINQSAYIGEGGLIMSIREYYPSSQTYGSTPDWLAEPEIIATYNTTKTFNVLHIKSLEDHPIYKEDRVAYITLSLPTSENVTSVEPIVQSEFVREKVDLTNQSISITDELKKIKKNLSLIKEKAENSQLNIITREISKVKKASAQIIDSTNEKIIDRDTFNSISQKFDTVINTLEISENTINEAITNSTSIELPKKISNATKSKALEELSYIQKVAIGINDKFKIYSDILEQEANPSIEDKTITFKYEEKIKPTTPRVVVSSNIKYRNSYVTFKMERSKETIIEGNNNWGVEIYYNFVDKNNVPINTDGSTSNVKDYTYSLTASASELSKTSSVTGTDIQTAQSGVYNTTANEDRYYDVISINAEIIDRNFWIFSGDDTATIRYSSYRWDTSTGNPYASIPDNIYLVLQCWNTASNKWIRTYNLKGYFTGKTFDLVDALNFKLLGLSLYSDGRNPSFIVKTGTRKYKCGEGSTTPSDATSSAYKEKRGTEQVPVKVNNNIVGIKIKKVTIKDGSFKFGGTNYTISEPGDSITVISTGSWASTSVTNSSSYSFGDAYISRIDISSWDDYEMKISFRISPGSNTKIPLGATINNEFTNAYGKTNFIFLEDNSSYDYKQLYSNFECTSTPWTNTGCTVTYRLYNKFSLNYDAVNKTKTIMYNDKTGVVSTVYTLDGIPYAKTHPQRDNTYDGYSLLRRISAIKFWFALSIQNETLTKKFCVSKSSISDKVLLHHCIFGDGESKSLNMVNALYEPSTDTSKNQIVYVTYNNTSYNGKTTSYNGKTLQTYYI